MIAYQVVGLVFLATWEQLAVQAEQLNICLHHYTKQEEYLILLEFDILCHILYMQIYSSNQQLFDQIHEIVRNTALYELEAKQYIKMWENNRNQYQFQVKTLKKSQPSSQLSIQPQTKTPITYAYKKPSSLHEQQFMQIPITHLKSTQLQIDASASFSVSQKSSTPSQKQLQFAQQSKQSNLYQQYMKILKNMNNLKNESKQPIIFQMYALYGKIKQCNIQITLSTIEKYLLQNMKNKDNKKNIKIRAQSKDNNQEIQLVVLFIDVTLNLWKMISQNKKQINKYGSVLQIVKHSTKKILQALKIINNNNQPSYFFILPDKSKNRLILLLIIQASEYLNSGNIQKALKICNLCSYSIIHNTSYNQYLQPTNIRNYKKFVVSKANQLKLHFLRMKIFNQLDKQKQEMQQIIICEGLLNNIESNSIGVQLNQNNEQLELLQSKQKMINKKIMLSKLEKRKNQILGKKRTYSNSKFTKYKNSQVQKQNLQYNNNSKFKQIRDSLQINQVGNEKTKQNCVNKSRSLKRIKSMSINNAIVDKKQKIQQELTFKKTSKPKFISLHQSKIKLNTVEEEQKSTAQINNYSNDLKPQNKKLLGQNKSVSAYKSRYLSSYNKNQQNITKTIKQKYQITSKRLTKRPLLTNINNKQFEQVLIGLQNQFANTKNPGNSTNSYEIKQKTQFNNQKYYKQLIIKRPQTKLTLNSNRKNRKNQVTFNKQLSYNSNKLTNNQKSLQQNQSKQQDNKTQLITQKSIQQCVQKVQKQTINKFVMRINIIKRKSKESSQIQNIMHSEYNIESQDQIFASEESHSNIGQLANGQQILKQATQFNSQDFQEQFIIEKSEPTFQMMIQNAIFPGVGVCKQIKVLIKKIKQLSDNSHSSQKRQKYSFILTVQIDSLSGIFWLAHKMDETIMLPNLSILENIDQRLDFSQAYIKRKNTSKQFQQQKITKKRNKQKIISYLKKYINITNSGMGLSLVNKQQNYIRMNEEFGISANFSKVYLQNRQTIPILFSVQSRFNIDSYYKTYKSNGCKFKNKNNFVASNQQQNFQIMNELKVLYVTIQKKYNNHSKQKNTKYRKFMKVKDNDDKEKQQIKENQQEIPKQIQIQKNIQQQIKPQSNFLSVLFPFLNKKQQNQKKKQRQSIDSLLVPVMKYVLMQQTSKPKHKLKTIITKSKQQQQEEEQKSIISQLSNGDQLYEAQNLKYGLLTPYIDDQSTVKVRTISTNIYGQVIGKYFMKGGNRAIQTTQNEVIIPQKVLLSLKYYLIIPQQSSISHKNNQSQKSMNQQNKQQILSKISTINFNYNVIDRFYDKLQYQFIMKLNNQSQILQKYETYIAKVTLYRVKPLYRAGLEKFYLLKFQIKERNAKSRINQFIATSYDIQRHFKGQQYNLISMLTPQNTQFTHKYEKQNYTQSIQNNTNKSKTEEQIQFLKITTSGNKILPKIKQTNSLTSQKSLKISSYSKYYPQERPESQYGLKQQTHELYSEQQQKQQRSSQYHVRSEVKLQQQPYKVDLPDENYQNDKQQNYINKQNQKIVIHKLNVSKNSGSAFSCHQRNNPDFISNMACLHSPNNRLSCPEVKCFYQFSKKKMNQKNNINEKNKQIYHHPSQIVAKQQLNGQINYDHVKNQIGFCNKPQYQSQLASPNVQNNIKVSQMAKDKQNNSPKTQQNIALCLKKISERIGMYKSQVYNKIGIKPAPSTNQSQNNQNNQHSVYFANKFRFSRNKHQHMFQQFLTPYLDSLQVLFQKTIKIQCDRLFAILTVFKIKKCDEFFIKIYVPERQKFMSFSFTCDVFLYLQIKVLKQIFSSIIQFDNFQHQYIKNQKQTKQTQLKNIVQKIKNYFGNVMSFNKKSRSTNQNTHKAIWNKLVKFLQFQRRVYGKKQTSYLIVKLGNYQAFLKNFTVQQYICVKSNANNNITRRQINNQTSNIIKIQVSLQEKNDGLNFKTKKTNNKTNKKSKNIYNNQLLSPFTKNKTQNIYQSQTNKKIVYINISSTLTHQRICFSYYLYELLHLIDYNSTDISNKKQRYNSQQQQYLPNYNLHSQQFQQIILNYAVLLKMLNYIKNQYVIQLQSNRTYLPKLYGDEILKNLLKTQVDKILLKNYKQQQIKNNSQVKTVNFCNKEFSRDSIKDNKMFNKLLNDLLNCTLGANSIPSTHSNLHPVHRRKNGQKISLNSSIMHQKSKDTYFLIRKVIKHKIFSISCLFFNKQQNKFILYLNNSKKSKVKQIQVQTNQHPMPYINIIINQCRKQKNIDSFKQINKNNNDCQFLLAFRNRFRKYHQNIMMLASI